MAALVDRATMDFVLDAIVDLDGLLARPRFAHCDRAMLADVLDLAQSIGQDAFAPLAALMDANEPRFVDGEAVLPDGVAQALQVSAQAGLFAASADLADGGMQLPASIATMVQGILTAANTSLANYQFLTMAAANLLATYGTPEQKAQFLPPMLEGRWFGTMCLSEPQAGSSLADIRTRAQPVGDGSYRITGSKMWISGGEHDLAGNIVHMVLARLPDAPAGVRGISLFVVPKYRLNADGAPGMRNHIALAGLNHKLGQRGTTNCLLNFGEGGDTLGTLLGAPNQGLGAMFHMMNEARTGVGFAATMQGTAGYLFALDYARQRPQGRRLGAKDPTSPQVPIIAHADVRRMLLAQKAAVEGGLALAGLCAGLIDRKAGTENPAEAAALERRLGLLTPIAKSWPSEFCLEANKLAIQVLGGYGYTRDYPVERHYRDNRLNPIHEGTHGIQGLDLLGRKVNEGNGEALAWLIGEMRASCAQAQGADLADEAARLEAAIGWLEAATAAARGGNDAERSLANATLYLDGFGHIVIAWLWLRMAMAAQAALVAGRVNAPFAAGKRAACTYFLRYALPHARVWLSLVEAQDDTCLAMAPDAFAGV